MERLCKMISTMDAHRKEKRGHHFAKGQSNQPPHFHVIPPRPKSNGRSTTIQPIKTTDTHSSAVRCPSSPHFTPFSPFHPSLRAPPSQNTLNQPLRSHQRLPWRLDRMLGFHKRQQPNHTQSQLLVVNNRPGCWHCLPNCGAGNSG